MPGQRRYWRGRQRYEKGGTLVIGRARASRTRRQTKAARVLRRLRNIVLTVLVIAAGVALWVLLDGRFYVASAGVAGTVRVSPDEVFQASRLAGAHILSVDAVRAEDEILASLPNLEDAQVACGLWADCTITVVERQPQMLWDDGGQLWGIAADGIIFPAAEVGAGGWLVRGTLPQDEDGRLAGSARVALGELWASGVEIEPELAYVPARGFVITDRRGWRVIVGQGTGMKQRLQVLELLAVKLEAQGVVPRFVDVRFPDAPYYSLSNDW